MICINCRRYYDDEFDFCPYCGAKRFEPSTCPKCGFKSYEFSFCPKCGTQLENQAQTLEKEGDRYFESRLYYHAIGYYRKAIELYESIDSLDSKLGIDRCNKKIKEIKKKH